MVRLVIWDAIVVIMTSLYYDVIVQLEIIICGL